MSSAEELKALKEKHDGVITTNVVEENNIHREYLRKLVKSGELERVSHGVYITPETWEDRMMILQLRKNKMIYSHETALYVHN